MKRLSEYHLRKLTIIGWLTGRDERELKEFLQVRSFHELADNGGYLSAINKLTDFRYNRPVGIFSEEEISNILYILNWNYSRL